MANWIEITPGWQIKESREGQRRTRVFHDQASTTGGLPAYGSRHPDSSGLFAFDFDRDKLGNHPSHNLVKIIYSPPTGAEEPPTGEDAFTDLRRAMRISGEMLTIDPEGDWQWESDSAIIEEQKIFKRIITGTYSIQEIVTSLEPTSSDGAQNRAINKAGRVNSAAFQGQGIANWLYLGADMEEFRNSSGLKRWRVDHNMAFRKIPGTSAGWWTVWRDKGGVWDKPTDTGGNKLYATVDFSTIFSTSGAA